MAQADAILSTEALRSDEALRTGPSEPVMHAMDEIHDRLESPAARMPRISVARSNHLVLPLFAFANAGMVIEHGVVAGHEPLRSEEPRVGTDVSVRVVLGGRR